MPTFVKKLTKFTHLEIKNCTLYTISNLSVISRKISVREIIKCISKKKFNYFAQLVTLTQRNLAYEKPRKMRPKDNI